MSVLFAASAAAVATRPHEEDFGTAATPSFTTASALAVDEGSGDLYVADVGTDEVQSVQIAATGGNFKLEFEGAVTGELSFNATAAQVASALASLTVVPAARDLVVTGGPGDASGTSPYVVTFTHALGGSDVGQLACIAGSPPLSGGGGCSVSTTTPGVNNAVRRFNADGTPHPFTALGTNAIDGSGAGGCSPPTPSPECDQTPQNGILRTFGAVISQEQQIAIDESGTATDGDVYVTDSARRVIDAFSPTGEYIGQLGEYKEGPLAEGPAKLYGNLACGVTVDPSGAVYVGDFFNNKIHKYVPGSDPVQNADNTANFSVTQPCNLAAGAGPSAGSLFAVSLINGSSKPVLKLDSASGATDYTVDSGVNVAVAVDKIRGHVYAGREAGEVREYDASGNEAALELFWQEPLPPAVRGIAADGSSDAVYVSVASDPHIEVFGSAAEPVVTLPASSIGASGATLNGAVDPEGAEVSECAFEYGLSEAYGESIPCAETPAQIGEGSEPVAVHADVAGLASGTAYHFRLRAADAAYDGGEEGGDDESFTTLGPLLGEGWAQDVGESGATIKAQIDPLGKPTSFHVEYGTSNAYGQSTAEQDIGSGSGLQTVGVTLEGLASGTTYHWRVVASSDEVGAGADRDFDTYRSLGFAPCANGDRRSGPGAQLPDCRAYEMVSPPDKGGGDIVAKGSYDAGREAAYRQAAADGSRLAYTAIRSFGDAVRGSIANQYLATRTADGWSSHALNPPQGKTIFDPFSNPQYDSLGENFLGFSDDLCTALLKDDNLTPLTADAIAGFGNLYRRDNCGAGADGYEAVTGGAPPAFFGPSGEKGLGLYAARLSADGSHILFGAFAPLTVVAGTAVPAANASQQLYDYEVGGGVLRLVSVLPGGVAFGGDSYLGSPPAGLLLPQSQGRESSLATAISRDGSRIFWTGGGVLYVRSEGTQTAQLSGAGPATFWGANPEGTKAIYSEGEELYEADVDKAVAEEAGASVQIAGHLGGVAGAAQGLGRIYFTSKEEIAGSGANEQGDEAQAGEWNLYLWESGGTRFIAKVSEDDRGEGILSTAGTRPRIDSRLPIEHASRISPDGRYLIFMSNRSPAGRDTADAATGAPLSEVYRYDAEGRAGQGSLACVSCNPSGARSHGRDLKFLYSSNDVEVMNLRVAAWLPPAEWANHANRTLSDNGDRVFFNSYDSLVPGDVNATQDLYQWEAPGTGGCSVGAPDYFPRNRGCVDLLSSGHSPSESEFVDADSTGDNVFFTTSSSLDAARDLGQVDVYDARVGGGFPPPEEAPKCAGDSCAAVPTVPGAETPTSSIFHGPGDLQAGCADSARKAKELSNRASRLRRAAQRVPVNRRAELLRKADSVAQRAGRLARAVRQCRRAAR